MSDRFKRLPRTADAWNTGYRCLLTGCTYTTGYWPDDGSAEETIYTHLSKVHPEESPS